MKCLQKILIIPYFHLYIPYFLNDVSITTNTQNHIRIQGRQTNTNWGTLEVYQSFNIHPREHHLSFRNRKWTLTTKFLFGRNNILEVAFTLSYSKGHYQTQPPDMFCKKVVFKDFAKVTRKNPVPESLFQ